MQWFFKHLNLEKQPAIIWVWEYIKNVVYTYLINHILFKVCKTVSIEYLKLIFK